MLALFDSPRRFVLLLALLLAPALAPTAAAQGRDDGSLYSRFGLGELRTFSSSRIQALGGGGTALWSYNYINLANPGAWSYQGATRAVLGAQVQRLRVSDGNDNSENLTSGDLGALQFSFPLKADHIGVVLAFEPYSRVNYRVQTTGQLIVDPTVSDTAAYRINYEGTGGLQQIRGGLGVRLLDGVRVGASADVRFGIVEEARRTVFDVPSFAQTNLATSTRVVGVTGTAGIVLNRSNLFGESDDLSLAASVTLPTALEANRALTLGESLDRDTLDARIEGSMRLPWAARAGFAYQTESRLAVVADVLYEPWTQFETDLPLPGVARDGDARLRDRLRLSGGFEFLPAGTDQLDPYIRRVAYRLGFYYDQGYVSPIEAVDVNTMALTGGFSLPSLFPGTRLDINLEAGTRGTTDQNLVRDVFVGLSATLNVGERWFVQRKLR